MIDGRTQLVGLLGWPVEHTLSPAMHNAAFDALGMNWRYVPLPVAPGGECIAAHGLMALGFRGANVTVPYKTSLVRCLDHLTDDARALGAVNTLGFGRGEESETVLVGHNTDHQGVIDALARAGFDPKGETATIVGAGGASRAAAYGLLRAGIRRIAILARDREQSARLVEDLDAGTNRLRAEPLSAESLVEAARQSALVVHATPVGMGADAGRSIWPDAKPFPSETLAYDLVYVPRKTRFLQQAAASGAACLDGVGMLVAQGARSFAFWTGRDAPIDVMQRVCDAALEEAGT